ncbi:MAG: alpha/beta hydrolase [Lachnospiraceae bacterium]|nr:alpha/beta hydrolase [Lachnospiraceae bacterium]
MSKVPAMIYEPRLLGEKSRIAVVVMHSDGDYFEFSPTIALAERGYRVFAAHFEDPSVPLDEKVTQLSYVFDFAKNYNGIEKVLILGHSGGATLMSAYQAIAENGRQVFQGEEKIIRLDDGRAFTPADGVMFLDSNFGNGAMSLLSLDPSVIDETDTTKRDLAYDLTSPANGFDPTGCHYDEAFVKRYLKAQGERMNRLIRYCQERVALIDAGKGRFVDDEPLIVPGGTQIAPMNKLFPQMTKYFSHTEKEWELIHKDGSITTQIVPCVRDARPAMETASKYRLGTLISTVKTFLKSSAVIALPEFGYDETTLYGVDWDSSYCVTTGNVAHIANPMLLMGMTGSYEYIAAEHLYKRAGKCADKTLAFVEGASHNFTANEATGGISGQDWGDTVKTCFDYVDRWIEARFV